MYPAFLSLFTDCWLNRDYYFLRWRYCPELEIDVNFKDSGRKKNFTLNSIFPLEVKMPSTLNDGSVPVHIYMEIQSETVCDAFLTKKVQKFLCWRLAEIF